MEQARTLNKLNWTNLLGHAQAATLDELAMLAIERATAIVPLLEGRAGIGGIYEFWKRLLSACTGHPHYSDHGSLHDR